MPDLCVGRDAASESESKRRVAGQNVTFVNCIYVLHASMGD